MPAFAAPELERFERAGRAYYFQPAPQDGPKPARLLVYFHAMQRGDPIGIERQTGYLDALSRWAAAHRMALLVPLAREDRCEGLEDRNRDWFCWPVRDAARQMRSLDRWIDTLQQPHGPFAGRQAAGLSRGAYFLSVAWAEGSLNGWAGVGLLSGAQSPRVWRIRNAPPIAIEYGRHDPGNAAYVGQFMDRLGRESADTKPCLREMQNGHLPTPDGFTDFLDFVENCRIAASSARLR